MPQKIEFPPCAKLFSAPLIYFIHETIFAPKSTLLVIKFTFFGYGGISKKIVVYVHMRNETLSQTFHFDRVTEG